MNAAHTLELSTGTTISDNHSIYSLSPSYTFEYFVTERIAPYIKTAAHFNFERDKKTVTDLDFRIGLALHFPTRMRVNIPMN